MQARRVLSVHLKQKNLSGFLKIPFYTRCHNAILNLLASRKRQNKAWTVSARPPLILFVRHSTFHPSPCAEILKGRRKFGSRCTDGQTGNISVWAFNMFVQAMYFLCCDLCLVLFAWHIRNYFKHHWSLTNILQTLLKFTFQCFWMWTHRHFWEKGLDFEIWTGGSCSFRWKKTGKKTKQPASTWYEIIESIFFLPCFRWDFSHPFRLFEADPYGCMAGQNGGSVS